ncbi:MAG: hypothetical protein FGM24_01790 [Candidatus Kapabacteria bacterium]|nr:hypothetical protein [Candidatus Kapabacteria bacterium]
MTRCCCLVVLSCALLTSCTIGDPYGVVMHHTPYGNVAGRIAGSFQAVEQPAQNELLIGGGARVGLRVANLTDGVFTTEIEIPDSGSVTMYVRSTMHERPTPGNGGISLEISAVATKLTLDDGRVIPYQIMLDRQRPTPISIINDGRYLDVTVGCTHLGRFVTYRPSTEWVILEPSSSGSVRCIDPLFIPPY